MALKATLISSFASFILGSDTFDRVKGIVSRLDDTELTGSAKKEQALKEIKILGLSIVTWAVNLAIELAVAYFRTKAGESKNG